MTKSTITRERLEQLADNNTVCKVSWDERIELAQIALAAMDSSESVELPLDYLQGHKDGLEWAAQLAEANHPETGDWLYDDPIELAKAIRKGPDMPPAQPVADSEPVAWRWRSGPDKRWHLASRGDLAGEVEPLYRHTQPAPVMPKEITKETATIIAYGLPTTNIGEIFKAGYDACRAARLNHSGDINEMAHVALASEGDIQAEPQNAQQNIPEIIPRWTPVSERMPDENAEQQVLACFKGGDISTLYYFEGRWDDAYGIVPIRQDVTHWMPLPAAPQEAINVLIPLVSRNEREVK
ncbi:TPA: DUF551 domain-containing protein [Klebsiella pneumoniae]|nr:DUF551 domain-containing protein [Klebsiella pneumoniae]